ncbi:MAG: hypothetical protein K6G47_11820 [Clostridia bacterium]|nr:hypothetical protein [Clostridia bacterium]
MRIDISKTRSRLAVITLVALMCVALMPVVSLAAGKKSDTTDYTYALAAYAGVFSTSVITSVNPTATLAVLSILGSIENAAIYSPDSAFFNSIADFLNGVPIIREAGKLPISNPYAAVFLSIIAAIFIVIHSTAVSDLVSKKISLDKIDTIALNLGNVAVSLLPLVTNEALEKDPPGSKGVSLIVQPVFLRIGVPKFLDNPWYTYVLAIITFIAITFLSNMVRSCINNWETIVAAFPVKGTSLLWQIAKALIHFILLILLIFAPLICFIICVHVAVAALFLFRILKRNAQYYKDVYVFTILRRIFKRNEPVPRVEKKFSRRIKRMYPECEIAMSVYTFHGFARLAKRSRVWLIREGDKVDLVYKRFIRKPYVISWNELRNQHDYKIVYLEQCARFLRLRTEDRNLELVMSNRYKPEIEMLTELLDLKDFAPVKQEIKETKKLNRKLRKRKKDPETI